MGFDFVQGACQVGQGAAIGREHLNVRDHAEHAVAHFFLKAVHHRQDNDQGGHAQRYAQHGHARDERDKAVAPGGAASAGIAPA